MLRASEGLLAASSWPLRAIWGRLGAILGRLWAILAISEAILAVLEAGVVQIMVVTSPWCEGVSVEKPLLCYWETYFPGGRLDRPRPTGNLLEGFKKVNTWHAKNPCGMHRGRRT